MRKLKSVIAIALTSIAFASTAHAVDPGPQMLDEAAIAREPAVRLAVPDTVGLFGMPIAPEGMSNCDEMTFYRVQAGLPARFDALGWRESNCLNQPDVKTFCCHGYWQLYYTLHADKLREFCLVFSKWDINGDEPLDKQRQACGAKVLYEESGYSPWGR